MCLRKALVIRLSRTSADQLDMLSADAGVSRKILISRHNQRRTRSGLQCADCMAVLAVWSDPVSAGFPCFTGKEQGNSSFSQQSDFQGEHFSQQIQSIMVDFPNLNNREID